MPQLTEDQIRQIEILLDPYFKERKEAEEYFKNRFINPFIIVRKNCNFSIFGSRLQEIRLTLLQCLFAFYLGCEAVQFQVSHYLHSFLQSLTISMLFCHQIDLLI